MRLGRRYMDEESVMAICDRPRRRMSRLFWVEFPLSSKPAIGTDEAMCDQGDGLTWSVPTEKQVGVSIRLLARHSAPTDNAAGEFPAKDARDILE